MDEIKSENINIGFWTKFLKHERDGFMVYPRLAPEFRTVKIEIGASPSYGVEWNWIGVQNNMIH